MEGKGRMGRALAGTVLFAAVAASLAAQTVTVTSPNGGETWFLGNPHAITWSFQNAGAVKVSLILRNGGGVVGTIKSNVDLAAGAWQWAKTGTLENGTVVPPGADYVVRIRDAGNTFSDASDGRFAIARSLAAGRHETGRPPSLLQLPRLAVTEIGLAPNAEGFGIIFNYRNVGNGSLPKAVGATQKPTYRVLIDGKETASGSLFIPAFAAPPGWEQKGYFGGWITLPSGAQGVGDYQFHVGNMITVHINENKVMNMDSHSLTQNLKPIALKYGYDLILNSVHYDWDANAVTMSVRIDGKIPANKQLRFSCPGEFHDDVNLEAGQRLYTHRQKLLYKPPKKQTWIVLRLFANLVPFPVGNEKFMDIDMRNNFQERRFERPPRPAESPN